MIPSLRSSSRPQSPTVSLRSSYKLLVGIFIVALVYSTVLPQERTNAGEPQRVNVSIIYTDETNGYLQACGCTANQAGGLAKRATLIRDLKRSVDATQQASILLDGGNLAANSATSEAILSILSSMKYSAVGMGDSDLAEGDAFVHAAETMNLPLLNCPNSSSGARSATVDPRPLINLYVDEQGRTAAFDRSDANSKAIATISIISLADCPSRQAIAGLTASLKRVIDLHVPHVNVVISHMPWSREEDVLKSQEVQSHVGLWIGMRQYPKPSDLHAVRIGHVQVVPSPDRDSVEVVALGISNGAALECSSSLHLIRDDIPMDQKIQEMVDFYYRREALDLQESSIASASQIQSKGKYASSELCADCHLSATKQWIASKHYVALRTLVQKSRLVPACLSCHSEQFRRTELFNLATSTTTHDGVSCTTCHGDSLVHVALGDRASRPPKVGESTCRECHTPVQDPKFDYTRSLARIRHW